MGLMSAQRPSNMPQPPAAISLSRGDFVVLALLYGVAILYCSLMLGPDGLHYLPLSGAEAWQRFRAIHFVDNASDQRADWIANALMIAPLGYLVDGALGPASWTGRQKRRAAIAFGICLAFILGAKYAQLFVPPRTVTLNYILAQALGAVAGIGLFRFIHARLSPMLRDMYREGDGLTIVLAGYTMLWTLFLLMPFDIALSPGDLGTRFINLPLSLMPGAGHHLAYRIAEMLTDVAAAVPLGMFFAVSDRELSFRSLTLRGVALAVSVTVLTVFVLSADPFVLSLATRPAGVVLGVEFILWLKGKDLWKRHYRYARYVPIALPVYVTLLLWGNGLLSGRWLNIDQAIATLDPRHLLPLWTLYIAPKVEAAHTVATTLAAFAPIGGMIWLRRGFWSKGAGFSAFVAFALSLAIEIGRTMKPGLSPEFSAPFIAAAGAAALFRSMPALWKLFEQEAKSSILRDTYASKVARVTQLFGNVELMPRLRPAREETQLAATATPPDRDGQLAAARLRIADLEQTVRRQERELETLRKIRGLPESKAG